MCRAIPVCLAAGVVAGCEGGAAPGPATLFDAYVAPGPATLLEAYEASDELEYLGIGPATLGEDLILIRVLMRGARDRDDVALYADCGVAGFGMLDGLGYARHIRTNIEETGGLWTGDAVYTLSPELPEGVRVIAAQSFAESCEQKGIPTV